MKPDTIKNILLSAVMGSLLVFGASCSKKAVVPPLTGSADNGSMSAGNTINYPPAEYSENSIEGTLDDNSVEQMNASADMVVDANTDPKIKEYLAEHGRSTDNLLPIYFDYDQVMISNDQADRLVTNAAYIQQTGVSILIAGNCDERETNEYNLALGERRALAAKQYLVDLGINAAKIRTISYGEEKPLFLEQDEFAYSQNRRADFIVE